MRGVRTFLSWVLAIFIIVMFLIMADEQLFSDPNTPNVLFSVLAEKTGIALFEPTGRYLTGLIEIFTAFWLLLPFSRRFGAFLALCVSGAAVALHLSPYLGQEVPTVLGGTETDGGELFYLAIALTAASGLLLFAHPKTRKRRSF